MRARPSGTAHDSDDRHRAREEASSWLARLERGLREEEGPALREWLKRAVNRNSIVETARLCHGPEVMGVLSALFPISPEPAKRKTGRSFLTRVLATATAVFVVALSTFMLSDSVPWAHSGSRARPRPPPTRGIYNTAVGETRDIKLPDGTIITLNTGTRVTVAYWLHSRDVYLPHGEASFRVTQDLERPFSVLAGSRQFQTVGGNFNLRVLTSENLGLTVTEGSVKVIYAQRDLRDTPALARLRDNMTYDDTIVAALETAQVEPGLQFVRKIEASEAKDLLAWQRGLIIFKGEPLEDAIAEVDRYTTTRFVLADDKLREIRISGDFPTGDIDGLLLSLRENFLIDSRRDQQGHVVLTALTRPHG